MMNKKAKMKVVSPMMRKGTKTMGQMMKKMTPRIQGQRQLIKRKIVSLMTVKKQMTVKKKK